MEALTHPVAVGIIAGLVLGKPLGITLLSWLAVRIRLAELPLGVTWKQLFAASWLAGIGFTMSLFIASSAFDSAVLLAVSKVAILMASLLASAVGFGLLSVTSPAQEGHSMLEESTATRVMVWEGLSPPRKRGSICSDVQMDEDPGFPPRFREGMRFTGMAGRRGSDRIRQRIGSRCYTGRER